MESDSSYSSHYARSASERSASTHDESTLNSESVESGEFSDSDESEITEYALKQCIIENILMCGHPWESKDEHAVNNDSVLPYERSDEQRRTHDETIDQLRVNRDTPLFKTSADNETTVAETVSDTVSETVSETVSQAESQAVSQAVSQVVSQTVSETLRKVDFDSQPSLLYRAIDTRSWKHAHEALQKSPKEASAWVYRDNEDASEYKWIFLPIHAACFSGAPLDLVKGLAEAYPPGVRMTANGGRLPLHIACEALARSTVITFLHNMYSDALYSIDELGQTPLQKAMSCERQSGRARIMKLLTSLSASDSRNNSDDMTPTDYKAIQISV